MPKAAAGVRASSSVPRPAGTHGGTGEPPGRLPGHGIGPGPELFLRFWRRPEVKVEALDTYLLRCAGNLAIDHLRSEGSRERAAEAVLPVDAAAMAQAPEQAVEVDHDLQRIEAALRALPERTRQIFLLNRIHGCKYGEIAKAMQLSQSAVEKHMMRALEACKASVAEPASTPRRPWSARR